MPQAKMALAQSVTLKAFMLERGYGTEEVQAVLRDARAQQDTLAIYVLRLGHTVSFIREDGRVRIEDMF